MRFLRLQVWVTIGQGCGVRTVHVGIQITDTRTRDAHIVGQSDIRCRGNVVRQVGRRYQIAVIGLEIVAITQMVVNVLPGLFVAQTSLGAPFPELADKFCIAGQNTVVVVVQRTEVFAIYISQIILGIRCGFAVAELQTGIQGGALAQRSGVVGLEDMVGGALFVLRETIGQIHPSGIVRQDVKLAVILIVRGGVSQLVGQCQTAGALLVEESLVVQTSVERCAAHLRTSGCAV